jgi:glutamate-ammonia-ligase adenylyltransferase
VRSAREAVVGQAPDPDDAGRRFDHLAGLGVVPATPTDDEIQLLGVACGRAPYLAALLGRDPGRLGRVARDPFLRREKTRPIIAGELAAALAQRELRAGLRWYRGDEIVRLGAREFSRGHDVEIGRELSRLAEVCFDAAIAHHRAELVERWGEPVWTDDDGAERPLELAVIGMGKLGGEELNFSSDVDVIYMYSSDSGAAGDRSLHEVASEWCKRVTASIGEPTEDDFVFRVDLRLRPEGSRGPIANSLASAERYYESFGRPWERQAWLKARACAGSPALGEQTLTMLEPFVYPRAIGPRIIEDVAELNRKIKTELDVSNIDQGYDVKNGVGGIREIEFFVQALQLIHAGQRPSLRTRSTLATLDQLLFAGLVTDAEHRALVDAYRLLRHVEHARQLESGRQTQRLPADEASLQRLAVRLGHEDAAAFTAELARHTAEVARLFATLGDDDEGLPPEIGVLLDPDAPPDRVDAALAELGFRDVEQAASNLEYARRKPASPLSNAATGAAARVAPELLREISQSPDPDQALGFVVDLIGKRGSWSAVWRLFDDNRPVLRLVVSLMGTSAYLARTFVNHPELIDALLQAGRARPHRTTAELADAIEARLAAVEPGDHEAAWNQLAELKQTQVLRVGLADVAGELDPMIVCSELSNLADAVLQRSFALVADSMRDGHGEPGGALAVLGLGKLGSRELGYASDLDIIFVYEDGADATYMTRFAQRLVGALHTLHRAGRLYETDTRLRPEGSKGTLVSSVSGWRRYHEDSARMWERQALIKLRPVAGDAALGARVAELASETVYGAPRETVADIAAAIREMRNKIEAELGGPLDFKAGRGGLIDIEFAAQFLQLAHGHERPSLRVRATLPALEAAAREGVAAAEDCAVLVEGYRFLRALEHRVRIVHDRSEHRLPRDPSQLDMLAHRMRYPGGDALVAEYRRHAASVRAAYDRIIDAG